MQNILKYFILLIFLLFNFFVPNAKAVIVANNFELSANTVLEQAEESHQSAVLELPAKANLDFAPANHSFEIANICHKNNDNGCDNFFKTYLYPKSFDTWINSSNTQAAYCNIHKISPILEYAISTRAP